jgi:hypothetical protein
LEGFVPEKFKVTPPTPNRVNDCEFGVRYEVEGNKAELFDKDRSEEPLEEEVEIQACERNAYGRIVNVGLNNSDVVIVNSVGEVDREKAWNNMIRQAPNDKHTALS